MSTDQRAVLCVTADHSLSVMPQPVCHATDFSSLCSAPCVFLCTSHCSAPWFDPLRRSSLSLSLFLWPRSGASNGTPLPSKIRDLIGLPHLLPRIFHGFTVSWLLTPSFLLLSLFFLVCARQVPLGLIGCLHAQRIPDVRGVCLPG